MTPLWLMLNTSACTSHQYAHNLQCFLDEFSRSASGCDLITPADKSATFLLQNSRLLLDFKIGVFRPSVQTISLPRSTTVHFLHHSMAENAPESGTQAPGTPRVARQQRCRNPHPGGYIPVNIALTRSILDYLSPAIIQFLPVSLAPLSFQNKVLVVLYQ